MGNVDRFTKEWHDWGRLLPVCRVVEITDDGLALGAGTILAPGDDEGGLRLAGYEERLLTLVSIACGDLPTNVLHHVRQADRQLRRNEKCLAAIHLAFARLPRLDDDAVYRLFVADRLIATGFSPRALLKLLDRDTAILDLAKYDPEQPRAPAGSGANSGRWVARDDGEASSAKEIASPSPPLIEGRSAASSSAPVAAASIAAGTLATDLFAAEASAAFLSAMAAFGAIVGAAAVFGAIFVPWPFSDGARRGTVPDDPDLHYEILPGDGKLTLKRDTAEGRQWVADAYRRADGVYIERDTGTPIAREVGGSLVFDADTLASVSADHSEKDARTDARVTTDVETESNKPKICPDPGPDVPHGASEKSRQYQYQIAQLVNGVHGLISGLAVSLINPLTGRRVTYDECRLTDGTLIEAKGPSFARLIRDPHLEEVIKQRWIGQARRQLNASEGRPLEWYFAEREAQEFADRKFAEARITTIKTVHVPYRGF